MISRSVRWIKQHQVLAFFILTYIMSWSVMIFYFLISSTGSDIVTLIEPLIEPLVVFAPALIAMLISRLIEPQPGQYSKKSHWIAFIVSWFLSAAVLISYALVIYELELGTATIVFSVVAIFPGWVLSSAYAKASGVRKHFSTLLKPRGHWMWYLVILLIFPGIPILAMGTSSIFGAEVEFYLAGLSAKAISIFLLLEFLHVFLITGGINEESGWRGFALPRLQTRFPVIVSALIVGFFWGMWHLPIDIANGVPVEWIIENRLLWNLVFSILMTWLYNRTNGSILAPALFHSAMNAFGNQFSITFEGKVIFVVLALFVIIFDRMWEKLPSNHLAVYQQPNLSM